MASYNKFEIFSEDQIKAHVDWDNDTFKIYLSNATPSASADAVKADLAEISAGNGYTAGGGATSITVSRSGITTKVVGTDVAWTASGGSIGPFRYAALYDDTPTSPADPLVSWWDYGSSITLLDTESFTVDLDASAGIFTLG